MSLTKQTNKQTKFLIFLFIYRNDRKSPNRDKADYYSNNGHGGNGNKDRNRDRSDNRKDRHREKDRSKHDRYRGN